MFTSKHQLNQVTALVSNALETNLSKTRHKIAKKAGFKNYDALKASVKDLDSGKAERFNIFIEDFPTEYLEQMVLTFMSSFASGDLLSLKVQSTRDIQLMLQGFQFKGGMDKYLDRLVIVRPEIKDLNLEHNDYPIYEYELSMLPESVAGGDLEHGMENVFYYGTLAQRLNPELIFDDYHFLLSNEEFTFELLTNGSIPQLNFFLDNPEVIEELCYVDSLISRYMAELSRSLGYRFDKHHHVNPLDFMFDDYLRLFSPINPNSPWNDTKYVFANLSVPAFDLFSELDIFRALSEMNLSFEDFIVEGLLSIGTDLGMYRDDAAGGAYDRSRLYERGYEATAIDIATIRHTEWIANVLSKAILRSNRPKLKDRYFVSSLFIILAENKVSLDDPFFCRALLTSPADGIFYNEEGKSYGLEYDCAEDGMSWLGLPLVAWFSYTVCVRCLYRIAQKSSAKTNELQYLISNLPDKLLYAEFDMTKVVKAVRKDKYFDELGFDASKFDDFVIQHKTARSMMAATIKQINQNGELLVGVGVDSAD